MNLSPRELQRASLSQGEPQRARKRKKGPKSRKKGPKSSRKYNYYARSLSGFSAGIMCPVSASGVASRVGTDVTVAALTFIVATRAGTY